MGQKKNNIRSFRYSDDVANILEGVEGKTLNEKFENLVRTCYIVLPEMERKIELASKSLESMRSDYWELWRLKGKVQSKLDSLDRLATDLDELVSRSEMVLSSRSDIK